MSIAVAFLFVLSHPTTSTVDAPAVNPVTIKVSEPPVVKTSPILKFGLAAPDKVSVCFAQASVDTSIFLTSDSDASEKNFATYFFFVI